MGKYGNLEEMIRAVSAQHPDRPAVIFTQHHQKVVVTYREFLDALLAKKEHYQSMNWHCVGISGTTSAGLMLSALSGVMAGKRVVMMDPNMTNAEALDVLKDTGVDYFYCDDREKRDALQQQKMMNYHLHEEEKETEYGGEFLFYTSGTTDTGKAVILSQQALLAAVEHGQHLLSCGPGDVILSILPLFHVFGFVCSMLWPLSQGAAVAIGSLRHILSDLDSYEVTIIPLVPLQLQFLLSLGRRSPGKLRSILVGAGPADAKLLRTAMRDGVDVRFGYGMTETASGLAMSLAGEDPLWMTPCEETSFRLGADGELFVRTSQMMDGYYHMPDETHEILSDGELATGDLAEMDERGRIRLTGRKKDILVLPNGTKIFCPSAEKKLARLLDTQVALTMHGSRLVLVVLATRSLEKEIRDKIAAFNQTLAHSRRIQEVILRDEPFPRNSNGKIRRYLL